MALCQIDYRSPDAEDLVYCGRASLSANNTHPSTAQFRRTPRRYEAVREPVHGFSVVLCVFKGALDVFGKKEFWILDQKRMIQLI